MMMTQQSVLHCRYNAGEWQALDVKLARSFFAHQFITGVEKPMVFKIIKNCFWLFGFMVFMVLCSF